MTVHYQNNKVPVKVASNATAYTLTASDSIYVGYSGQTINLPAPSSVLGYRYVIKAPSNISSTITINASTNSSMIDGLNSYLMYDKNDTLEVVATSSGWVKVSNGTSYICSGRLASDQTITSSEDNIIHFQNNQTLSLDPLSWWNNSTYKYQPTLPGYYNICYSVWFSAGASSLNQMNIQIRKGLDSVAITQSPIPTSTGGSLFASSITYLNGSTDYIQFTAYSSNPTSHVVQGSGASNGTYFTAIKV